jgi:CBS domain-containing protein
LAQPCAGHDRGHLSVEGTKASITPVNPPSTKVARKPASYSMGGFYIPDSRVGGSNRLAPGTACGTFCRCRVAFRPGTLGSGLAREGPLPTHRRSTMPNISDIMTTEVQVVQPQESLRQAATLMQELDIGSLPVCDGERLLGMLTDRDITVYGVAQGLDPDASCVSDVMTDHIEYCTADQDVDEVMRQMGDKQVRRLPVIDADKNLIGIVSLGDLAVRQSDRIDRTVRDISQPGSASSGAKP